MNNKNELISKIDKHFWEGERPMKIWEDKPCQPGCRVVYDTIEFSPFSLTQLKEIKKLFLEIKENFYYEWYEIVGGLNPETCLETLNKRIDGFKVDNKINLAEKHSLETRVDNLESKLDNIELLLKNLIEIQPK